MQLARCLGAVAAAGCLAVGAANAGAAEVWSVQEGRTTFHFNTELMTELGLSLTAVEETASPAAELVRMEAPHWSFRLSTASDLSFEVDKGVYSSQTPIVGHLAHEGGFAIRDNATGAIFPCRDFEIVPVAEETAVGLMTSFRLGEIGADPMFDLVYGGVVYHREQNVLGVYGFDLRISPELAAAMGRPELERQFIGLGESVAGVLWTDGEYAGENPGPNAEGGCSVRDVKLGILNDIDYVNRSGSYPTGVVALSMATTSCNVGNCDVEWEAAMNEDHPGISMTLYRETNGVLEQIGKSDIKHGFYALSSSQCTQCQNPSNGTFLGVGCSDTYGVGNNSDRQWLAPRAEWSAYPGTWECQGSHFAGGQNDCVRRHGGSGHGPTDHRLEVTDAELDVPGNYFYEAYYVVRDDDNKINNYGWRPCTFSRSGNSYTFNDGSGYPVNEGPLILTWGELHSWSNFTNDGQILLASSVKDLGGGNWAYEYALLNFDSDRQVKSFSVPVGSASISSIGFHDPNLNDLDSWQATVESGVITWTTGGSTGDNPIAYGQMYNFRFISNVEPDDGFAAAGAFYGGDESANLRARIPGSDPASVGDAASSSGLQLRNAPNPTSGSTTITFQLAETESVALDIFDATGREVRSLVRGPLPAGSHAVEWDGSLSSGQRASAGVYYYRLRAGEQQGVRSILLVD